MNEEVMYDRASAKMNGEMILIETLSGYYGSSLDPKGSTHVLSPSVSDGELGAALVDALEHSRVVKPQEAPDLYLSRDELKKLYDDNVHALMKRFGYKTRRAMFKNMKRCSIHRRKGATYIFRPSKHDRLEGFQMLKEDQNIVISAASSDAEVGHALRIAFDKCI